MSAPASTSLTSTSVLSANEEFVPLEESKVQKSWGRLSDLRPVGGDIIRVRYGQIYHAMLFIGGAEQGGEVDGGGDLGSSLVLHFYPQSDLVQVDGGRGEGKANHMMSILLAYSEANVQIHMNGHKVPLDRPGCVEVCRLGELIKVDSDCMVDNMEEVARSSGVTRRRRQDAILSEMKRVYEGREEGLPLFNIVKCNCETFVLNIRYGTDIIPSPQAEQYKLPAEKVNKMLTHSLPIAAATFGTNLGLMGGMVADTVASTVGSILESLILGIERKLLGVKKN